jgi:hypothetical protein
VISVYIDNSKNSIKETRQILKTLLAIHRSLPLSSNEQAIYFCLLIDNISDITAIAGM